MTRKRTAGDSARTVGVALLFGAAWFVAMAVATSVEDGGLLPLSDESLALELPEHCAATRTLSGIAISCDEVESSAPPSAQGSAALERSVVAADETHRW